MWLDVLEQIAPLWGSASWDNTGRILDGTRDVKTLFLTIDLTPAVAEEALAKGADAIVAYHPPIFKGLKRLTYDQPQTGMLLQLIRAGVHVYSPHTALDAAHGGMNDWLLEPFGKLVEVAPLEPSLQDPAVGSGRRATLVNPVALPDVLPMLKDHLGLSHLRLAAAPDLASGERRIHTVAVCPGAGGSLFAGLQGVDLMVTGEMRHHDVLAQVTAGGAAILTDHTHTERGYLPFLAKRLSEVLKGCRVIISQRDADPLVVV